MNDVRDRIDSDEFVSRPPNQLMNYPVHFRWEFTRRHPYYLGLWQIARNHHRSIAEGTYQPNDLDGLVANFALGAIGAGGCEPVPPETQFREIAGEDPQFLYGSLQPITIRAIVTMLLRQLSPECQEIVGKLLLLNAKSATDPNLADKVRQSHDVILLNHLLCHPHPDFDRVTDSPLFVMHLGASQETIKEDANRQARLWKERRGMDSPKIHTTKFDDYLTVWDAFEGWVNGSYDLNREQTLKQIAGKFRKSISTVYDQYRSAFRLIIGQDFTPARWWATMGRMKLALCMHQKMNTTLWLARRRFARHQDLLVSGTTLTEDVVHASATVQENRRVDSMKPESDVLTLADDIQHLISLGKTDAEILTELELNHPRSADLLAFIRKKGIDLDGLKV